MSESEKEFHNSLRDEIKKELRWWKYIIGIGVILVIFFSNIVARGMFFTHDLETAKEERRELAIQVKQLTSLVEDLTYSMTVFATKTGIEIKKNPFKK